MSHLKSLRLLSLVLLVAASAMAQQSSSRAQHVGRVQDWSYSHIVYSGGMNNADLQAAAKREPRILFHLAEHNLDGDAAPMRSRAPMGGVDGGNRIHPKMPVSIGA